MICDQNPPPAGLEDIWDDMDEVTRIRTRLYDLLCEANNRPYLSPSEIAETIIQNVNDWREYREGGRNE